MVDGKTVDELLARWGDVLRLRDWDIRHEIVTTEWRKSGDVKVDLCNKMAIVMVDQAVPPEYLEELVVHELLHVKLYGMDQMIEELLNALYGCDEEDPKRTFAYVQFMRRLESTTEDLTKGFLTAASSDGELSFKRVQKEVEDELSRT